MKMRLFLNLLLISLFFFSVNSQAQTKPPVNQEDYIYEGTSTKFAIMVPDVLHFKVGVETAERMHVKKNGYKFEMVVIGELDKEIVENEDLKSYLDRGIKAGMNFTVCEYALDLLDVNKAKIDKRIEIIPHGWLRMYELKDKGYNVLRS